MWILGLKGLTRLAAAAPLLSPSRRKMSETKGTRGALVCLLAGAF